MIYDVGLFCFSNRIHFKTALWLGGNGLCFSVTQSCPTLWDPLDCNIGEASLSFTISLSLLKFMFCALIQALSVSTDAYYFFQILYQFASVAQSCLTPCDPRDCSMLGLRVYHRLSEFTQTHVHWVSDAIQLSHPLLSPSPPAFNLFQHQGLF